MGKGTDKLYITHSEWSSSDAYSASAGSNAGARAQRSGGSTHASFKRLPFNFCAASLQPFKNPVCTADGTIFDVEVIGAWLEKQPTNPVTGAPLGAKDLIRLNFARNADTTESADRNGAATDGKGEFIDPVTFKVFTDNTHIVAIRHDTYANVFAWDTVERMNIKAKMWQDLVDDASFSRQDIITLQDPQNAASRDLSRFKYLQDGHDALSTRAQDEQRQQGSINIRALGRIGDKVLRAKEAVERARHAREAGGDINRTAKSLAKPASTTAAPRAPSIVERKLAANAATYTTGRAAASFTSTGLTPETSGERALLSNEEYMLKPKRVKHKGYARLETNLGPLTLELHTETAPKAVWNFVRLAQRGDYRAVPFHRNIRNFMVQGGDPTGTGRGGQSIWGRSFADELEGPHLHDARGVLSMANKGKDTNSSQFFITYRRAPHLDRKHTVFGRVLLDEGGSEATLRKMEAAPAEEGTNRPLAEMVVHEVVVLIDPFDEFMREKGRREDEVKTEEALRRAGGTDDDRTTWTGKRIRGDGGVEDAAAAGVGKYLKTAMAEGADDGGAEKGEVLDTWEEPVRKKTKMGGGFGNFDGW
ncbi:cyclophilin-like protein [Trichocladium antarcticum]|uniref:Peptidyl-prolyl cis-trans isomerase-like 2 n=1 Tax=Trichocladium antarcticum TaxID=1450529 RepID=A0AAN6ZH47_9PEZI|nr:cyclophilin-like protein [Trichocladium antarcticum]